MNKAQTNLITLCLFLIISAGALAQAGTITEFRPGELLEVRCQATPGSRLAWDLPGLVYGLEMREIEPGLYRGRFMVLPSMVGYSGAVQVRASFTDSPRTTQLVAFVPGDSRAVQTAVSDQGELCFAFDEMVNGRSVTLTEAGRPGRFPNALGLENNFFVYGGEWSGSTRLEARTTAGSTLSRRVHPELADR